MDWIARSLGRCTVSSVLEEAEAGEGPGRYGATVLGGGQAELWVGNPEASLQRRLLWRRVGRAAESISSWGLPSVLDQGADGDGHEFIAFSSPFGRRLTAQILAELGVAARLWILAECGRRLAQGHRLGLVHGGDLFSSIVLGSVGGDPVIELRGLGFGTLRGGSSEQADLAGLIGLARGWCPELRVEALDAPTGFAGTTDRCAVWSRVISRLPQWDEQAAVSELFDHVREPSGIMPSPAEPALPGSVRPEPFLGRQRESDELRRFLDDPEAPPVVVIGGPPGAGKRRLLKRITGPREADGELMVLRSSESGPAAVHRGLYSMLEGLLGVEGAPLPRLRDTLVSVLGEADGQALTEFLRPTVSPTGGAMRFLERGDLRERRAYSCVDRLFRKLTEKAPLLWIVDDLHSGHWLTGRLITYLARSILLDPHPMRIAVLVRTPARDEHVTRLLELWTESRVPYALEVPVGRLPRESAIDFVQMVTGGMPDRRAASAERLGDGIPQLLVQMGRALVEEPGLAAQRVEDAVDAWRRRLLGARIDRALSAGDRGALLQVLVACALLEGELPWRSIDSAFGESSEGDRALRLTEAVEQLLDLGLLRRERWLRDRALQLAHPLYRRVLMDLVPDDRAATVQLRLADALGKSRHRAGAASVVVRLLTSAGKSNEALDRALLCEDMALVGGRPAELEHATVLVEGAALRAARPDMERRAIERRAAAWTVLEDPERALQALKQVRDPAYPEVTVAALQRLSARAVSEGLVGRARSLYEAAERFCNEHAAAMSDSLRKELLAECRRLAASVDFALGNFRGAESAVQELINRGVAKHRRSLFEEGLAWSMVGLGRRGRALEILDRALDRRDGVGGERWLGRLYRARGSIGAGILSMEERRDAWMAARFWAHGHGDWRLLCMSTREEGAALALMGEEDAAAILFERSLQVARVCNDPVELTATLLVGAAGLAATTRHAQAAEFLDEALRLPVRRSSDNLWIERRRLVESAVSARAGRTDEALALLVDLPLEHPWIDEAAVGCVQLLQETAADAGRAEIVEGLDALLPPDARRAATAAD